MELRVLRYFLTVAQEESISAAAKYLHITQPTLSRQLLELEEELGVQLFIRGKRKITLTNEGLLFRKRAEEITELVRKTRDEVTSSNEIISGDIYIGGGETFCLRPIAKIIKDMQQEYPGIRVHLFSGNAEDVTERLDKGLLDFGVLIQPTNVSKYQSLRLPGKDTWGVLMQKDHPLAIKDTIAPKDLWDVPLISSRQHFVSGDIEKWIKKDYEKLNLVATYNLVYNASLMVEEGVGVALCLDNLVNTSGDSSLCFKPLMPRLEASLDIVWKKYQVFSKASALFLERLQDKLF
ncbi:DNA-binding transcriptional LysR family regulator [Aequitasia blattaphilus]|uniref:LysR family transcriptional regulator n=1 Tax=Aequitasia blattaphilus TaxID=2949332 RepID=A0ABT1EEU0_9FIRM|nr:LysR family transcriptional regulator [Aequitasia blattaphilus]MCP1102982.1 LysR family transcriptional regulator [Aequitasia blattaphilus]MCR8615622.1 LysR family transcriptional regulator [Aequitasia blattaphilus]